MANEDVTPSPLPPPVLTEGLSHWIGMGLWAVTDQGLFAISNFALNLLLARWLPANEYGAFAVAFSIFLLLGTFHTAILTEPELVFGAGKYRESFQRYLALLICGNLGIALIVSSGLLITSRTLYCFGSTSLAKAFWALALSSPFLLLLWLLRRSFYVQFQPRWAAIGGVLYLTLVLVGSYGLYMRRWLSSASALALMGVSSLFVSLCFVPLLRPVFQFREGSPAPRLVFSDHWNYGRWSCATAALTWIPGNVYYTILPAWIGLTAPAALRAVMNIVMPILHANSAISGLLTPAFAKAFSSKDAKKSRHLVSHLILLVAIPSFLYWLLLFFFGPQVLAWLYAGKYNEYASCLTIVGLIPLSAGAAAVLGSVIRAMERPDILFGCYGIATVFTLTGGLVLSSLRGVAGAAAGLVLSSLAGAITMAWFFYRVRSRDDSMPDRRVHGI